MGDLAARAIVSLRPALPFPLLLPLPDYAQDAEGALELIEVDDDGGEDLDSRLEMNLDAGVTYFVEVEGLFGSAGQCTMLVSPIPN